MNPLSKTVFHSPVLKRFGMAVLFSAVSIFTASAAHASTAAAALVSEVVGDQGSALTMVQRYDFGRNLQTIGFSVAHDLPAYSMIVKAVGEQAGDALIRQKLSQFAPKYQEQWNRNLAASYSAVYTEEELRSFAEFGPQSDRIADFNAKRGDVGSVMRDKSQGLLSSYVTDAMNSAFRSSLSTEHASKD